MASNIKIVADSSADFYNLDGVEFSSAPLKIVNSEKEYVDDENLDVKKMVEELLQYKGKVSTACPGPGDWIKAFGDAETVIAVAISSHLSGSYNSLLTAKQVYESEYPERRVYALDSINAGPGMQLLVYKIKELIEADVPYEKICEEIEEYKKKVSIVFMLSSVHNFANNGRVNPLIAKAIGILNIKLVAKGSLKGEIKIISKVRGDKKGLPKMIEHIDEEGITGEKIIIGHVYNENLALQMKDILQERFPNAEIKVYQLHGLCSFYAESGGLLVAFESTNRQ